MKGKNAGSFWILLVVGIVFVGLIIVFAVQTWLLVDWLFPSTNLFMKIGTVGGFDVMAVVWAGLDMFYLFQLRKTKHMVQGMWFICFALATAASVIQMYLASATRLDFTIDPNIIHLAYAMVILDLTANLIALTTGFRWEWAALFPNNVVEQDNQVGGASFAQIHEAKTTVLSGDEEDFQ